MDFDLLQSSFFDISRNPIQITVKMTCVSQKKMTFLPYF